MLVGASSSAFFNSSAVVVPGEVTVASVRGTADVTGAWPEVSKAPAKDVTHRINAERLKCMKVPFASYAIAFANGVVTAPCDGLASHDGEPV